MNKTARTMCALLLSTGLLLGLGAAVGAQEMQVVFEDDFSDGATKWEILEDDAGTIKPGPNNEYLSYGDYDSRVHMRVPDLVTNRFDLVLDLDMATGSLDWLGVRIGTTEEHPTGPGHLIFIRPTGKVQIWVAPSDGSWKTGNAREHFELGSVGRHTEREEIVIRVRPNRVEINVHDTQFVFDDIHVAPGSVDLFSIKPGPVRLYHVTVLVPTVVDDEGPIARPYIAPEDEVVKDISEHDGIEPALYLSFDHDDARDESGFGNHGVVYGDLAFIHGVSGRAAYFNNFYRNEEEDAQTDMYIAVPEAELLEFGTSNFSLSFWYKSDQPADKTPSGALVGNKNWYVTGGSDPGWLVYTGRDGVGTNLGFGNGLRFDAPEGGGGFPEVMDMRWHHIALTFDRHGDMTLYIDGEVKSRLDISAQAETPMDMYDLVIGADGRGRMGLFNAAVDELYFYRRVLTPEDVKNHYHAYSIQDQLDAFHSTIDPLQEDVHLSAEMVAQIREGLASLEDELGHLSVEEKLLALAAFEQELEVTLVGRQPLFSFVVMADSHIPDGTQRVIAGLQDAGRYDPVVDVVVHCGDITEDGKEGEYAAFYNVLDRYSPTENVIAVMGNHDVRWQLGGYEEALERYLRYNGKYMASDDQKAYFDHWFNDYHFIALCTERDLKDDAYLSEDQLAWLDQKLGENAEPNKPKFVVIHQPPHRVNVGLPSEQQLETVLAEYPNTVLFSGHLHNGFSSESVVDQGYAIWVDVPSLRTNNPGYAGNAVAFYVNVYEDGVKLRARDFDAGIWLTQYDYSVSFQ